MNRWKQGLEGKSQDCRWGGWGENQRDSLLLASKISCIKLSTFPSIWWELPHLDQTNGVGKWQGTERIQLSDPAAKIQRFNFESGVYNIAKRTTGSDVISSRGFVGDL